MKTDGKQTASGAVLAKLLFTLCVGSAMHVMFDLFGRPRPLAWLLPTSESLFEHLKMAFYPPLLYGLLAPRTWRRPQWWSGRAIVAIVAPLILAVLYYLGRPITGDHLAFHMAVFVIAVAGAEVLGDRPRSPRHCIPIMVALGATFLAVCICSYAPPAWIPFRPP